MKLDQMGWSSVALIHPPSNFIPCPSGTLSHLSYIYCMYKLWALTEEIRRGESTDPDHFSHVTYVPRPYLVGSHPAPFWTSRHPSGKEVLFSFPEAEITNTDEDSYIFPSI